MRRKVDEMVGRKYGRLQVLKVTGKKDKNGRLLVLCKCDCGREVEMRGSNIASGLVKSCGCLYYRYGGWVAPESRKRNRFPSDLTGLRFGRLTVKRLAYELNGRPYWKCTCDCGTEAIVSRNSLVTGGTKSCGCIRRDKSMARLYEIRRRRSCGK